jgi:hypothetical protein
VSNPSGLLPPIGLEVPMSCHALNVPLKVESAGDVNLDLKGGIRVRVEADLHSGLGGRMLKVISFEMNADHPQLGRVTLSQADVDTTPLSSLELRSNTPTFRSTFLLDWTLSIETTPDGPRVLSNPQTATMLQDHLTAFPPQGALYQLQQPVDFAIIGSPDQVRASLLQLPTTVTHNA